MKLIFRTFMMLCVVVAIPLFSVQTASQQYPLHIATHNIYLMPRALYPNWGQMARANLIAKAPYMQHNEVW